MNRIRVAICGYGNLGKGVEKAISQNDDMELACVFTRRDPFSLSIATPDTQVVGIDDENCCNILEAWQDMIDVVILCGGSATDLPKQVPIFAKYFNTVDSFDTHAKIPEYYKSVDKAAFNYDHLSLISCGWDPGLFSLNRLYAEAILPQGNTYTFWGKGVSQGHSDAIRRIEGVKDARQYTIPIEDAMNRVREGENPELTTREKHLRECYVVAEEGADKEAIEKAIVTMPNYFADYDTTVHFVTEEELKADHSGLPHGGLVIRSGKTGDGNNHTIEYSLNLDSNPEFTGSVLVAYARAVSKMHGVGLKGAISIFDVPPTELMKESREELMERLL